MKVVVLNGSPRRNGLVSRMLGEVTAGLPARTDVETFVVHDLAVKPCCGCMKCRSLHRCVLPEDDAHRVAEALRTTDALVVGSPCYWGGMSGELKVLFDRMVYALMEDRDGRLPAPLHKGKPVVMVATCNTAWPFSVWFYQTSGVFRSLREIFRWSGFRVVGTLGKSNCRKHAELTPREREWCKKLARRICRGGRRQARITAFGNVNTNEI